MFERVFDLIARGNKGTKVSGGGKDESIDVIFLKIFRFFVLSEHRT